MFTTTKVRAVVLGLFLSLIFLVPVHADGPPPTPVKVQVLSPQSVPFKDRYPAQLNAPAGIDVTARVSAPVTQVWVRPGDWVQAGTALYQLEDSAQQAALAQQKARVLNAQLASVQAERDLQRLIKLQSQGQWVSEQDLERAKILAQSAQAQWEAEQLSLTQAQVHLDYTRVLAPISGRVQSQEVKVGQWVHAGQTRMTQLIDDRTLWVDFTVSDFRLNQLKDWAQQGWVLLPQHIDGFSLEILAGARPSTSGQLIYLSDEVNPLNASFGARGRLENSAHALRSGQFVRVELGGMAYQNVFKVPQKAILQVGQSAMVYLVREGKAVMQPAEILAIEGSDFILVGGVAAGDQLIVNNLIKLRPGSPVQVISVEEAL